MRCLTALQTCLALLLAFFVSPFQHIHTGSGADHDHDHSATMHAHFYHIAAVHEGHHGPELIDTDDDDHAAVWPVDSFTLVLSAGLTPFVPSRFEATFFTPAIPVAWVDVVEERGHDPPPVADRSIPRAPPS
jgi:hypothetical protein